jgi:hypothetical protein
MNLGISIPNAYLGKRAQGYPMVLKTQSMCISVERPSAVALSHGLDGAPQPRRRPSACVYPALPVFPVCAACAACGLALFFYSVICVRT